MSSLYQATFHLASSTGRAWSVHILSNYCNDVSCEFDEFRVDTSILIFCELGTNSAPGVSPVLVAVRNGLSTLFSSLFGAVCIATKATSTRTGTAVHGTAVIGTDIR